MKHLQLILFLATAFAAVIAGCSGEDATGPGDTAWNVAPAPVLSSARIVGPSEIILCIDVSDSISQAELESQVSGFIGCLGDQSLFPTNGDVGLSIWAYGDTIAPVVEALTAVTPTTLNDVFQPALTALVSDRLVGGSSADLAAALTAAAEVLAAGSANDRHVLISGSGEAVDEQAARDACGQLERAGARVSAIGVNSTVAGEKLLMDCAEAGSGIYVAAGEDFDEACHDALAWMLVVELMVTPETAELPRGEEHKVEAAVFRAGDLRLYPEVGLDVGFSIAEGPNSGLSFNAVTDTNGLATWGYPGDGGAGTDVIVTTVNQPQTGVALTDTVTVDWLNTAPDCDAGGPYMIEVDADTALVQLDGSASNDADGDTLSFLWSIDCDGASFDDATLEAPVLTLTGACLCADSPVVDLLVFDASDSSSCQATVSLDDQRPPVLVAGDPYELWPPNHKYKSITAEMLLETAEDACGNPIELSDVVIVEVRSDEPDDSNGDGSTVDDILISCPNSLQLRAERRGGGDGRVYTVVYRITDESGNSSEVEAEVVVPHDRGKGRAGGDDDGGYTVSSDCPAD